MKKFLTLIGVVFIISLGLFYFYILHQKADKQHFINKCPYCHSKNILHKKPIYKNTENFVIPSSNIGQKGNIVHSGISKPIAHFDVEYHCNDCNKTFYRELEVDLLLQENRNKFKIEYKE